MKESITTIPTDAFSEAANLNLADENGGKITVEQQLSIQQPKPEEYMTISKWDLGRISKRCESLTNQPTLRSDIILTIGSLSLGASLSYLFSGVDITRSLWRLVLFIVLLVIGAGALIVAFFLKKGERSDAKRSADDIEEIITHIYGDDEE